MTDIFDILGADRDAKTGLVGDEPESYYHSTGWLGSTAIKCYVQSPVGFYKRYVERDPGWQFKGNTGTRIGSIVDDMISGQSTYVVIPEEHMTKSGTSSTAKASVAWKQKQIESGFTPITQAEHDLCRIIIDRIMANPCARELILCKSMQEVARVVHPSSGVPVQVRADYYCPGAFIADLKTTSDNDLDFWGRTCLKYGYDVQAGLYREVFGAFDAAGLLPFYHIVAQTNYPYDVRVYEFDEEDVDAGWQSASAALDGISRHMWDDAQTEPLPLKIYRRRT